MKKINTNQPNKTKNNKSDKDREINQQEGYRDSTEQLMSRILFPVANAQEKKGPAVGREGDRGLIIKHAASNDAKEDHIMISLLSSEAGDLTWHLCSIPESVWGELVLIAPKSIDNGGRAGRDVEARFRS